MSDVVLQERYEIVGRLGAGGQGTVFEAIDRRLGIHVAVKKSIETRDDWREAFVREARLLAGLRHQNLPIVSDHFVEANSQYLVLELVPGDDLEERVARQRSVCSVDEVFAWTDQLLDALEYLHSQSPPIIHRDIKPRNLKVRPDGRLILLDFGLAKGRPAQDPELDVLSSMPGYSYGFAPLEQIVPEGTDARSDLYAVGATMYFLLSGRPPPDATVRSRDRTRRGDPIRPLESINPGIPGLLAGLIHRALELHPDRRFQSATEMRRGLTRARRSMSNWTPTASGDRQPIVVDPPDTPTRVPRRRVRATTVSPHESDVSADRPKADATPAPAKPPEENASAAAPSLTPVESSTPVDDPPMPPWAKHDPGQRADRRLHRLGGRFPAGPGPRRADL